MYDVWPPLVNSKSMDQAGKVVNPARGQLNRENEYSLSPLAPENLISSRDGFDSPVPRQPLLISILGLNLVLTHGIPPEFIAIHHRASPEFIGSRNCVPMAFTAESPPAQGRQ